MLPLAASSTGTSPFPPAQPEEVGMSSAKLREAMAQIGSWVEEKRIVGGMLVVIRHGKLVWQEAVGSNDTTRGTALHVDDILLMRSMTKPLTGVAILMLVEEGKLALDDRASRYLSSWDTDALREITIRQLLTHTSGISGGVGGRRHADLAAAVDAIAQRGPAREPGSRFRYSDSNSAALARIIEVVAGVPGVQFLQERILDPLGMRDSYLVEVPESDPRHGRTASGYRKERDSGDWRLYRRGGRPDSSYWTGSGGLYATGLDYARFLAMMQNGGEWEGHRLLTPESVALAVAAHVPAVHASAEISAFNRHYGLHWFAWIDEPDGGPFRGGSFGHGGAEGTFAWADPEAGLIALYLTQSNGTDTRSLIAPLVYAALQ